MGHQIRTGAETNKFGHRGLNWSINGWEITSQNHSFAIDLTLTNAGEITHLNFK